MTSAYWAAALALAGAVVAACSGSGVSAGPKASALELFASGCASALVPRHGSAVALGGQLVATAAHVVAGASEVRLVEPGGRAHAAAIAAIDTQRDIAVLRATDLDRPPLPMHALAAGNRGAFFGFGGENPTVVTFTVVRAVPIISEDIYVQGEHSRPGYELGARVVAGDSGAGLIGTDGALGGIVWATNRTNDDRAWGISTEAIVSLLASVGSAVVAAVPCP